MHSQPWGIGHRAHSTQPEPSSDSLLMGMRGAAQCAHVQMLHPACSYLGSTAAGEGNAGKAAVQTPNEQTQMLGVERGREGLAQDFVVAVPGCLLQGAPNPTPTRTPLAQHNTTQHNTTPNTTPNTTQHNTTPTRTPLAHTPLQEGPGHVAARRTRWPGCCSVCHTQKWPPSVLRVQSCCAAPSLPQTCSHHPACTEAQCPSRRGTRPRLPYGAHCVHKYHGSLPLHEHHGRFQNLRFTQSWERGMQAGVSCQQGKHGVSLPGKAGYLQG